MKFADIKVGDKVAVSIRTPYWGSYGGRIPMRTHALRNVTKVTDTQFTTDGGDRIRKIDGKVIGSDYRSADVATEVLIAKIEAKDIEVTRWTKANSVLQTMCEQFQIKRLTIDQMEAIAAAYEATLTKETV